MPAAGVLLRSEDSASSSSASKAWGKEGSGVFAFAWPLWRDEVWVWWCVKVMNVVRVLVVCVFVIFGTNLYLHFAFHICNRK